MRTDREALELSGETQIELMRGLCDRLHRNYNRRDYEEADELMKLAILLNSSVKSITEHLSRNSTTED